MLNKEQKNSPAILSVSQLNKNAKLSLEKKFNNVWVKGEISEFTNYKQSGHWYFTLKDENASINCNDYISCIFGKTFSCLKQIEKKWNVMDKVISSMKYYSF